MSMSKLRPTFTFTEDRLAELRAVVPEAFADGKINWDTLREALGEYLEEAGQEHFGLSWPGKREARHLAAMSPQGTLQPQPGIGVHEEDTRNLFIEGDNLEVLKLLLKSYAGRVKLIYIDPPYNTGNDFIYPDDYSEPLEAYLRRTGQADEAGQLLTTNTKASGRFHSNWLSMMYPRLRLARQFLQQDGIIFVSIDDNESHNLRLLMDEVFGEENYLATFFIQVRFPDKTLVEDADFHKLIEMVYVYGRSTEARLRKETGEYSLDKFTWKVEERGQPRTLTLGDKRVDVFTKDQYEIVNAGPHQDHLKEIWATGKILDGNSSGRFFRDYLTGRYESDGYGVLYKVFGIGDDQYDYRYFTGPKRVGATKGKYYQGVPQNVLENISEHSRTKPIPNFYNFADSFGNCRHEGQVDFRNGKKPIAFIRLLLSLATSPDSSDLVLDFFAGSSSTAHAIMDLNHEDGGARSYIMVQFPEPLQSSEFSNIAELSRERIRRSIGQIRPDQSHKPASEGDMGFKCYRLARSNFKPWQPFTGEDQAVLQLRFNEAETPLLEGWQPQDLLTEAILVEGFPLDSRITQLSAFTHNRVLRVTSDFCAHNLTICLDNHLHEATFTALDLRAEDVLVCLDSALDDEAKLRLADRCNLKVI